MHYPFVGLHVLASISAIKNLQLLNNPERIKQILERGVKASGAHALAWQTTIFEPQGCSLVALLSESHLSVHTYPEHESLFFDAFTCGIHCTPRAIFDELLSYLDSVEYCVEEYFRSAKGADRKSRDLGPINTNLFSCREHQFHSADCE